MENINVLIKPTSGNCNMRCKYCFYNSVSKNRDVEDYGMMDVNTLENIIKKALKYSIDTCVFSFQGGEPTLIGIEFYEEVIKLQNKYNKKNIKIKNTIQTNGLLIDRKWALFLYENNFLVGLSLDGYKEIHDLNRVDVQGKGSYDSINKCIKLLDEYNIDYNILSVVTSYTAKYAKEVYNYFKNSGFKYIQFIPCLDPLNNKKGKEEYSLNPRDLEQFLKVTFDEWYKDFMAGNYISIRYFDNLVYMILGRKPEACSMNGVCSCNLVIEADGSVHPCDFYVIDKWRLGNINYNEINEMKNSNISKKFILDSFSVTSECIECKWNSLCRGGCRREREDFMKNKIGLNYYCTSYKNFFDYAYNRLVNIAKMVSHSS